MKPVKTRPMKTEKENKLAIIKRQAATAKALLEKLYVLDPRAIVAGGAPRDWALGKPATDLDVYLCYNTDDLFYTTIRAVVRKVLGLPDNSCITELSWYRPTDKHSNMKQRNPQMYGAVRVQFQGMSADLIFLKNRTSICNTRDLFDVTVCEAAFDGSVGWKGDIMVTVTTDFINDYNNKRIVQTGHIYESKDHYLDKLNTKFPNFSKLKIDRETLGKPEYVPIKVTGENEISKLGSCNTSQTLIT